jgi:hypothetical protein
MAQESEEEVSCPTCSGTLACIIVADMERCFQCERCGTVTVDRKKTFDGAFERVASYIPKLVGRCRQMEEQFADDGNFARYWIRLGIAESIETPEKRKEYEEQNS